MEWVPMVNSAARLILSLFLHLTKDLDQRTARVSKQVKSRFSRRRRRSPPDSSGLPGARAAA
jgi:hypothetical protein